LGYWALIYSVSCDVSGLQHLFFRLQSMLSPLSFTFYWES